MSTDIAEKPFQKEICTRTYDSEGSKRKRIAPKGGGKKEAPKGKSGGGKRRVRLKRDLKREFVRQYMILDIVQEEKILI